MYVHVNVYVCIKLGTINEIDRRIIPYPSCYPWMISMCGMWWCLPTYPPSLSTISHPPYRGQGRLMKWRVCTKHSCIIWSNLPSAHTYTIVNSLCLPTSILGEHRTCHLLQNLCTIRVALVTWRPTRIRHGSETTRDWSKSKWCSLTVSYISMWN